MFKRPIAAFLHLCVYVGFIIINIEMLEIVIDGVFGTHRVLSFLGGFYDFLIGAFEILAILVLISCVIFLIRRNIIKIKRLNQPELNNWPKSDANYILITEILLMTAFLFMNAADFKMQQMHVAAYHTAGSFPISQWLTALLPDHANALIAIERGCWWFGVVLVKVRNLRAWCRRPGREYERRLLCSSRILVCGLGSEASRGATTANGRWGDI